MLVPGWSSSLARVRKNSLAEPFSASHTRFCLRSPSAASSFEQVDMSTLYRSLSCTSPTENWIVRARIVRVACFSRQRRH